MPSLCKFIVVLIHIFFVAGGQIFEWWYFKKYGTSFIEQFTITYLSPLLGGVEPSPTDTDEIIPAQPELTVPGILHNMYSVIIGIINIFRIIFRAVELTHWHFLEFMRIEKINTYAWIYSILWSRSSYVPLNYVYSMTE